MPQRFVGDRRLVVGFACRALAETVGSVLQTISQTNLWIVTELLLLGLLGCRGVRQLLLGRPPSQIGFREAVSYREDPVRSGLNVHLISVTSREPST